MAAEADTSNRPEDGTRSVDPASAAPVEDDCGEVLGCDTVLHRCGPPVLRSHGCFGAGPSGASWGRAGLNKSRLAERYIDEGIRIEDHPGVVFRDGPAGRRPGLASGPDVWEVIGVPGGAPERGEAAILYTADYLNLPPTHVRSAVSYKAITLDSAPSQSRFLLVGRARRHRWGWPGRCRPGRGGGWGGYFGIRFG